jgi:hypothetical protein
MDSAFIEEKIKNLQIPLNKEKQTEKEKEKDNRNIANMDDMTLYCNKNCYSCAILAHSNIFKLSQYNLSVFRTKHEEYPVLKQNGIIYKDIDLAKKLYENINITDIQDDKLISLTNGNKHINCTCNDSDYKPSLI